MVQESHTGCSLRNLALGFVAVQTIVVLYQISTNLGTAVFYPWELTYNYTFYSKHGITNINATDIPLVGSTAIRHKDILHTVTLKERKVTPGDPPHVYYQHQDPLQEESMAREIQKWMDRAGAKCVQEPNTTLCPCVPPGLSE